MTDDASRITFAGISLPLPSKRFAAWAGAIVVMAMMAKAGVGYWIENREKLIGGKTIPIAQLRDLQETQRHFGQTPDYDMPLYDDARGVFKVAYYRSDDCAFAFRRRGDKTRAYWITDPDRAADVVAEAETLVVRPWQEPATSAWGLGTAAWASSAPACGVCPPSHDHTDRPAQETDPNPDADGYLRTHLTWNDGCRAYFRSSATRGMDVDRSGQVIIYWECCTSG